MFYTQTKYKKKCKRCGLFFPVAKSTPATREYCNDCRVMMGKQYDAKRFNPLRTLN